MSRRVYHYNRYRSKNTSFTKKYSRLIKTVPSIALVTIVGGIVFFSGSREINDQANNLTNYSDQTLGINTSLPKPEISPNWPSGMQSAVGAVGYGVISKSHNNEKPLPMASLAKVMAVILIIEKDNLGFENGGKIIELKKDDVELYDKYLKKGGVVTKIKSGQKISQKEAITAMIVSSSNNLADTTVIDSYGSIDNYLEKANEKAAEIGLNQTNFADVTGFSPESRSTASDLIRLSEYVMKNEFFRSIASIWQTEILNSMKITNTNIFLDFEGNNVIGIKTGLTDEAGGTYMAASKLKTDDGDVIALAVTLGAKNHFEALDKAQPLLRKTTESFKN